MKSIKTALAVKKLKPEEKLYEASDRDGFRVRVYPSGRKVYCYTYRIDGKLKRLTLGVYGAISFAEAKEKHREALNARKRGEDPAKKKETFTIDQLSQKFITEHVARHNTQQTLKSRQSQFKKDILPNIGKKTAETVTRRDVISCLKRHADNGAATGYNHTLGTIRKMFAWAIDQGMLEVNPALGIKNMKTKPRANILTDDEIRLIYHQRFKSDSDSILAMMLFTGQRGGEVKSMDTKDIKGKWWSCEQHKGGRDTIKRTYLTRMAKSLIRVDSGQVFRLNVQGGLAKFVKRRKYKYTPHDIRRTCATILASLGYDDYLIHRFLGHSMDKLTSTYNVHQYDRPLREMAIMLNRNILRLVKNPPRNQTVEDSQGVHDEL